MLADSFSRRAFVTAAGAALLAADPRVLEAAWARARQAAGQPHPYRFKALTSAQAADLEAMAMRILPSDGTPGAKEAGVVHFIDQALGSFAASRKPAVLEGLTDLNQRAGVRWPVIKAFSALAPAQQDELLKTIQDTAFFGMIRFSTLAGMFANPSYGGNHGGIGWKLIGHRSHGVNQPPFGYYDAEARKGG